jgi:hypothetical protein
MCGESSFDEKFSKFQPRQYAFRNDTATGIGPDDVVGHGGASSQTEDAAFDTLVRTITDQVMRNLQSA